MKKDELRPVKFLWHGRMETGWCLIVTGGMMSEPQIVVEIANGSVVNVPAESVKFTDR